MIDAKRQLALEDIRQNIGRDGHHVYLVSSGNTPRFAYTIGLLEPLGYELLLPGAIFYMADDVLAIINFVGATLKVDPTLSIFTMAGLGSFTLGMVHPSWSSALMLGALDYHEKNDIPAVQIFPDKEHWTIDIPNTSEPINGPGDPVWRWLYDSWDLPIPSNSDAMTNLDALRGKRITEAARWEEGYWELFAGAGPDVLPEESRVVPIATLLATDKTLGPVIDLRIGQALWRDKEPEWHEWRRAETSDE